MDKKEQKSSQNIRVNGKNGKKSKLNIKPGLKVLLASPIKTFFFILWIGALALSQVITTMWETNQWMANLTYGILAEFLILTVGINFRKIIAKGKTPIYLREKPKHIVGYIALFLVSLYFGGLLVSILWILAVFTQLLQIMLSYSWAVNITQYLFDEKLHIHEKVKKPGMIFAGIFLPLVAVVVFYFVMGDELGVKNFGETFFNSFSLLLALILPVAGLTYLFLIGSKDSMRHRIKSMYVWLIPVLILTGLLGFLDYGVYKQTTSWLWSIIFIFLAVFNLSLEVLNVSEDQNSNVPYNKVLWIYFITLNNELIIPGEGFDERYYFLIFTGLAFLIYLYRAIKKVVDKKEKGKFTFGLFFKIFFTRQPIFPIIPAKNKEKTEVSLEEKKSETSLPPQFCTQCGSLLELPVKFCKHCGNQV